MTHNPQSDWQRIFENTLRDLVQCGTSNPPEGLVRYAENIADAAVLVITKRLLEPPDHLAPDGSVRRVPSVMPKGAIPL